jgi:hypothetical protein
VIKYTPANATSNETLGEPDDFSSDYAEDMIFYNGVLSKIKTYGSHTAVIDELNSKGVLTIFFNTTMRIPTI